MWIIFFEFMNKNNGINRIENDRISRKRDDLMRITDGIIFVFRKCIIRNKEMSGSEINKV